MLKCRIAFLLATLSAMDTTNAAGLCSTNEMTVFNCELKENHKIVSMCASKNLTDKRGFLQYRYGLPNRIELTFPKNLENSQTQFGYDEYSRPDLSTFVVGVNNENYRYEISETTEGSEEDGVTTRTWLVSSETNELRSVKLTCLGNRNTVSDISMLGRVLRCDKEHAMVEGACD